MNGRTDRPRYGAVLWDAMRYSPFTTPDTAACCGKADLDACADAVAAAVLVDVRRIIETVPHQPAAAWTPEYERDCRHLKQAILHRLDALMGAQGDHNAPQTRQNALRRDEGSDS